MPLVYDSNFQIEIKNRLTNDNAIFYGVLNPDNTISDYYCKYQGGRYSENSFENYQVIGENKFRGEIPGTLQIGDDYITGKVTVEGYKLVNDYDNQDVFYANTGESDLEKDLYPHYITEIIDTNFDYLSNDIKYPSLTFNTGVTFDKVSTELVETQSLYVLFEENNDFKKVSDIENNDIKEWANRYKLLFFIDCQKQTDFRFFTADSDEVVWTNKIIVDFSNDDYRVDVGFTTTTEGIYEQPIIVCLIDTESVGPDGEMGLITPIGSIQMTAEAIGEDERYKTLFTNFGLPHPSEYMKVFKDTDLNEGNIDNIQLNKNAKMLFLSYADIFPYVGTYKALINAVKLLKYDDVFFKEWYKIVGKDTAKGGYVNYDMKYHADLNANTINNLTIEERIHLRKLNWISMVYKINEEIATKGEDRWGFPYTKNVHSYDDNESLVKLIALKEWLQKYIIGVNCRIIDIGGEGIYYERYRLDSYGSYQNIIEWNNVKNLAPYFEDVENKDILIDTSANITVNIGIQDEYTTLDDVKKNRLIDYCEGYLNEDNTYYHRNDTLDDNENYIYVGGTFGCPSHLNRYELRASSKIENFLFGEDFIVDASVHVLYSGINSSRLRVVDNEIEFNPIDLFNNKTKTTIFRNCPIIQLEKANIRVFSKLWSKSIQYKIYPDLADDSKSSYFIKNEITGDIQSTIDYVTLLPPAIISENEDYVSLKPLGKETVLVKKIITNDVVSDYMMPTFVYAKTGMTYGLKYSADNIYNLPFFSIFGYQIDKIDDNLPEDTEFILEILDGKMIFPDYDNNRTIYLNFNFDNDTKEQTVEVNAVYNSDQFYPIEYKSDKKIYNFINENDYTGFAQNYLNDPDSAISYNFIKDITVNNIGSFTVDVLGFDSHNNIFAANCDGTSLIKMPETSLFIYTNNKNENGVKGKNVDASGFIEESFIDFCVYKPNYLISGITTIIDDINKSIKVKYPTYSYSLHKPEIGEYIHFVDITDRYAIKAIDSIDTHTYLNNEGVNTYEGYTLISEANCPIRYARVLESTDYAAIVGLNRDVEPDYDDPKYTVSNYLNKFYDAPYNFSDVNIVFYNELGGYPIAQTYANMANESAFYKVDSMKDNYTNNDYRIRIDDDSWKGYVWTAVKDTERQLLINKLTSQIANLVDDSSWGIQQYEVSTSDVVDSLQEEGVIEKVYLNIKYENIYKPIKILVNKLFDNFNLGSVNSSYFAENSSLQISTLSTSDESLTAAGKHASFLQNLDNIVSTDRNRITKESIEALITPTGSNSFVINRKECYAPYALFSDVLDPSINELIYPYTKDNNQQLTGLLIDIETLLFDCNYNDILEDEASKLVNDYEVKDESGFSIFEKIVNSFIDASTVKKVTGAIQYDNLQVYDSSFYDAMKNGSYTSGNFASDNAISYIIGAWMKPFAPAEGDNNLRTGEPSNIIWNDAFGEIDDNELFEELLSIYKPNYNMSPWNYEDYYKMKYYCIDDTSSTFISKMFFNSPAFKQTTAISSNINKRNQYYTKALEDSRLLINPSSSTGAFLNILSTCDELHYLIPNIREFMSMYLNTEFVYNNNYNSSIIETLLTSLKGKQEINNKLYSDMTVTLFNKLCNQNSVFLEVADDELFGNEKNTYELVSDPNNYLKIYPNLNENVSLDGSIYITSNGYKIITDSISENGHTLEIGDYVKIDENQYTTIGFIDHLDNGKYSVKTDKPMCIFTQEEYTYPVNYVNIPINVYKNDYYEYAIWDNEPTSEDAPYINETGKELLAYYNGSLYKYSYEENLDADNIIEFENIRYVANLSHISLDENSDLAEDYNGEKATYYNYADETVVFNDSGADITDLNEIWKNAADVSIYQDEEGDYINVKVGHRGTTPLYNKLHLNKNNYLNEYIFNELAYLAGDPSVNTNPNIRYGHSPNVTDTNNGVFVFRLDHDNPTPYKNIRIATAIVVNYFVISKNEKQINLIDLSQNFDEIDINDTTERVYNCKNQTASYSIAWFSKEYAEGYEIPEGEDVAYINYYQIIDSNEDLESYHQFDNDLDNSTVITFDKFINYDIFAVTPTLSQKRIFYYNHYNFVVSLAIAKEVHHIAYPTNINDTRFNTQATIDHFKEEWYYDENGNKVIDDNGTLDYDSVRQSYVDRLNDTSTYLAMALDQYNKMGYDETNHVYYLINNGNYEIISQERAEYIDGQYNDAQGAYDAAYATWYADLKYHITVYDYIFKGCRGNGVTPADPISYAHWELLEENVASTGDEAREIVILEEGRDPRSYIIYTKNQPKSTPVLSYTNPDTPKCYITSNGYTLNIPESIYNNEIQGNDYITTELENNYTSEKVKINKIQYLPSVNEYKLFLNKKIYQFNEEEYNETYVSKLVELDAYKMTSEEADIDVIKTNLQCILINCLSNMENVLSPTEEMTQRNIRKYYAALYVLYSWIIIKLTDNIKRIVDNYYTNDYNNCTDAAKVYINKYLVLTDPYSLAKAYSILDSYAEAVRSYFYTTDTSTGEKIAGDLLDTLYTEDFVPIYDKLLTASSMEAMNSIRYINWATKGEIHVQDLPGSEGVYAVVTHKSPNEIKKEDTYDKQFHEVDYDSIITKDSISVYPDDIKKSSQALDPNDEIVTDSSAYYVKIGDNVKSGYSKLTADIPENAVTCIKDMLNSSYVSTYVKPTWIAPIKIGLLDKKIIENSPLDANYDYMYVTYNTNIFKTTFRVGEKVKIIFESEENKEYIGQSTYEVVGYDLTSNSIIIKGYINEEYLNAAQQEVWAQLYTNKNENGSYTILTECHPEYKMIKDGDDVTGIYTIYHKFKYNGNEYVASTKEEAEAAMVEDQGFTVKVNEHGMHMYFVETDKTITVNDSYYTLTDVEIAAYDDNGQFIYDDLNNLVTNKINISIPIKYMAATAGENVDGPDENSEIVNEDITEDEINDGSNINENEDIIWYYRVYSIVPSGQTILPVTIYAETSEKVNMYISYAHHSYVDYEMKVIDSIETPDGMTEVEIEYNTRHRRLFDFIDDTFSITSREFNIGEGMGAWMNSDRKSIKLNDSTPNICDNDVYRYDCGIVPELDKDHNLIAFSVNLADSGIDASTCTNYWKVYKRSPVLDKDILAFESFNPVLYLDYTDKGTYSIESFVFDKYGNTTSKLYKGIYKVK